MSTTLAPPNGSAHAAPTELTVKAFVGDGAVMLAMDMDEAAAEQDSGLAGFAISRNVNGATSWVQNRLSFEQKLTSAQTQHAYTDSNVAPIQKYRWIDFPEEWPADVEYTVTPMYFTDTSDPTKLRAGASQSVSVTAATPSHDKFHLTFTRGYLSSQAYSARFHNAPVYPPNRTNSVQDYLFDTTGYEAQWAWLGFHGRETLFAFLNDFAHALSQHRNVTLDCFIYDVDEPNFVRKVRGFGNRVRVILDDSKEKGAVKPDRALAAQLLSGAGAAVQRTHFQRFAHDKVLIWSENGKPVSVLCGSANFSIRGLYVQANSVLRVDEPSVAQAYADVFDAVWQLLESGKNAENFTQSPLAQQWKKFENVQGLPNFGVSFAPHTDGDTFLGALHKRLARAQKNVIFAMMAQGSGLVMQDLLDLTAHSNVYTFGTVQQSGFQLKILAAGGGESGEIAAFAPLKGHIPENFLQEDSGGQGQVIHHKFVVVDFNGDDPCVYFGSSNFAKMGEEQNGDNLLGVYDRDIATIFAVEGVRLADHYAFRDKWQKATSDQPLTLEGPDKNGAWWKRYYQTGTNYHRERIALAE